jgi:hypothetical protein
MEKEALRQALASSLPITIVTASGKTYEVEHEDYIFIAPDDATTVIVFARGQSGFTILDLKTITDVSIHGASA